MQLAVLQQPQLFFGLQQLVLQSLLLRFKDLQERVSGGLAAAATTPTCTSHEPSPSDIERAALAGCLSCESQT